MQEQVGMIVYASVLVMLLFTERLLHTFMMLFCTCYTVTKEFGARQVLVSQAGAFASVFSGALNMILNTMFYILSWWLLIILALFFFSAVYVSYEELPLLWINMMMVYNVLIGPWISQVILLPLYIIDLFLKSILPFWNAMIWFIKMLIVQGFLPVMVEQFAVLITMGETLIHLVQTLVEAWIGYIQGFNCGASICNPVFNLLTPLGYTKELLAQSLELLRVFCGFLTIPFDLVLYPLFDMNLALFFHNLWNFIMQFFIGVPVLTKMRCDLSVDNSFKVLMCTPDFNPVFMFLVAASTNMGVLFDNWLNVALVILQKALTGTAPECSTINDGLIENIMQSGLIFPVTNPLTVIGLTNWFYAITDGNKIVYKGNIGKIIKTGNWPRSVNPLFGIAAVSYNKANNVEVSVLADGSTSTAVPTTSMLGCNCDDTLGGVRITCVIAPLDLTVDYNQSDYFLGVVFPDRKVSKTMQCAGIDLYVKSIRFSFQRYSSAEVNYGSAGTTSMPELDCISKSNCREADASVWVVPRCGQDLGGGTIMDACVSGSSCFPYCMGVRLSGSGNNNILLSSATQWKQGKTLINRDCNIRFSDASGISEYGRLSSTVITTSDNTLGTNILPNLYSSHNQETAECFPLQNVVSRVTVTNFNVYNTYSPNQPFVITGDALFTAKDLGSGISSVIIERLESDEKNEFTLHTLSQDFPAEAPPNVISDENNYLNQDKLLLPYGTRMGHPVAVSTRNYVFYATNPDYGVFTAYFDYCTKPDGELGKFGLIIKSSYGPLRIYRVKAYAKCAAYSCGAGIVKSIDFDGFKSDYSNKCDLTFNTSITQMEYLNEDNIVLVVSSSPVTSFQTSNNTFSVSYSKIYWLNPNTMQVADTIWQTTNPTGNYGALCPAMQRLPRVGSFFAEIFNAGVYLGQYVIGIPLYFPGLVGVWSAGGKCPARAYGHSILDNCGDDIMSLDNFFDSVQDAASIFWHSLNSISYFIQTSTETTNTPITDIIDGMAEYGEGTVDLWAIRSSVITLTNVPIKQQIVGLWGSIQSGSIGTSVGNLQANVVMWGRFSYSVVSSVIMVILKSSLMGNDMTSSDIWNAIWNTLYNVKADYYNTVVRNNRLTCSGIKLMFGLDNPWAGLAYHYCIANVGLFDSIFDTVLNVVVYIPMTVCLCKESRGYNPVAFATDTCAKKLPLLVRPQLYILSAGIQQFTDKSLCETILGYTRDRLIHSMDPWFSNINLALMSLSDAVDYILIFFDAQAGKCLDFQGNPHVVSIIPQPMDYFQMCGKTSSCKTKCASEWNLFQEYKTMPVQLKTVSVDYESMFFPGQYDSSLNLNNAIAVIEVVNTGVYCTYTSGPKDYVLLVAEYMSNALTVRYFCVPQAPARSVYFSETSSGFTTIQVPGSIMQSYFVNPGLLCFLTRVDNTNSVYFVSVTKGLVKAPDIELERYTILVNVVSIWPLLDSIIIDIIARRLVNGINYATPVSYMYHFYLDLDTFSWRKVSAPDINSFSGDYAITRNSVIGYTYLLIPIKLYLPAYQLTLSMIGGGDIQSQLDVLSSFDPNSHISSVQACIMSSVVIQNTYVFAVFPNGWNWLKQIRLSVSNGKPVISDVTSSTPVVMDIQTQGNCDERSCEGCQSVFVQRICQAYNKCALVRCVGTLVNEMRPLCAIGQTLSFKGSESLQMIQGGWVIIAEMLSSTLRMSLSDSKSINIEWPDDVFMGYICNAKDLSVEFWAIFTSTLNSLMHLSVTGPSHSFSNGGRIDKNKDASLTIKSTALNAFIAQFTLLPIYQLLAMKQILTCQVNGVLSLMDISSYKIRIMSPDLVEADNIISGACLTTSAEVQSQLYHESSNVVTGFVSNALNFVSLQAVDPYVHILDAGITYIVGLIHTLATLIMAMYPDSCNAPDYFLNETVQCACDDYRLSIPVARSAATLSEFPLWCTGTLGMIDHTNSPIIVVNPYSYAQLQAFARDLQTYVACISTRYDCANIQDDAKIFERQGVTLVNVLVKCRENYMKKQWDPKAYAYFDPDARSSLNRVDIVYPSSTSAVAECLILTHRNGGGPEKCLSEYLAVLNIVSSDAYWAYERSTLEGPQFTDACLVFSGPALVHNVTQFSACVDGDTSVLCEFSAQVWDVSSDNDVPVAEPHIVLYKGVQADGLVQRYYKDAQRKVISTVLEALYIWGNESNDAVQIDFFSTEGDAIHQIMDCIFMGPYSKVNYWPVPQYREEEDNLKGPSWYRDDHSGASRQYDIDACDGGEYMPFTCGSESRKSVVRYFVKTVLSGQRRNNNNKTLIQKIVVAELRSILAQWTNIDKYGCLCTDGTNSPGCCTDNVSSWLPDSLMHQFQDIHSGHVLDALEDEYEYIYNLSMQNAWPWIYKNQEWLDGNYDWVNSTRAKKDGIFKPTTPNYNYSTVLSVDPGQTFLWGICHASLKQIFFTVPVVNNNIRDLEKIMLYNGNPDELESAVENIVKTALEDSPVYRHYHARYHPSDSLMCKHTGDSKIYTKSYSSYDSWTQMGHTLLQSSDVLDNSIPTWEYTFLAMGNDTCTCGWQLLVNNGCLVPVEQGTCTKVCDIVECSSTCVYHYSLDAMVRQALSNTWFCPTNQFSSHWGVMDTDASTTWMSGTNTLTFSSRDVLKYGRGGIRLGNIQDVYDNIHENEPVIPIKNGQLLHCDYDDKVMDDPMYFANELFPVMQGVQEGAVASYCLRYFIEKARFLVLGYTKNMTNDNTNYTMIYLTQQELMYSWGRKCASQLYLLHLCVSLNVFRPAMEETLHQRQCVYLNIENAPNFYTTAECLVYLNGEFYDPCRCMTCSTTNRIFLSPVYLQQNSNCKLRFNPIEKATNINAPIGLWDGEEMDYLDYLNMSLLEHLLNDNDAVGNTPDTGSWINDEGFMKDVADDCDLLVDYWPDEMSYPVGYHVSTVCETNDNAYRSFMNAFTLEETDNVFKYQNDIMRDIKDIDLLFGVGGLCRQNNFGKDMANYNSMVYCTRVIENEQIDYTLPGFTNIDIETVEYSDSYCSDDSFQLPWDSITNDGKYTASSVSIGTVPNMPSITSSTYPETLDDMYDIGSKESIQKSWENTCGDYPLHYCSETVLCPGQYRCRGRRCSASNVYIQCTTNSDCGMGNGICEGVCIHPSVQCIRHSDCTSGKMCSGSGKCVLPQVIVHNLHDVNSMKVEFQVQGGHQPDIGDDYSLIGGSYWGYMGNDLLSVHGMCSYTHWYTYFHYYMDECAVDSTADVCWIDPTTTVYRDMTKPQVNLSNVWWSPMNNNHPTIMYVRPTNCDRDYERLENFTFHRPGIDNVDFLRTNEKGISKSNLYAKYTRAYESAGVSRIPLVKLDISEPTNFLYGPKLSNDFKIENEDVLMACNTMRQCIASPFTMFFKPATRMVSNVQYYNKNDNFICGAIGYLDQNSQCRIDLRVFPLYSLFCLSYDWLYDCEPVLSRSMRRDVCALITEVYDARYQQIVDNVNGLISLFYMFNTLIVSHLDVMYVSDCAVKIYDHMKKTTPTNTLYYPYPFILKEMPFDYFYQCILLSNSFEIHPDVRVDQTCASYKQKQKGFVPDFIKDSKSELVNHLKDVRKGFSMHKYVAYNNNMTQNGRNTIDNLTQKFINMYPTKQDQSRPICSMYRRWKAGLSPIKRVLMANAYSASSCVPTRLTHLLNIINKNEPKTFFSNAYEMNEAISILKKTLKTEFSLELLETSTVHREYNWRYLFSETFLDPTQVSYWSIPQTYISPVSMLDTVKNNLQLKWDSSPKPGFPMLRFNYNIDPPTIYDLIHQFLEIEPSSGDITKVDNGYNMTCAYTIDQDPNIVDRTTCTDSGNLRSCDGGKPCVAVPIFSHEGRYFCHYHYLIFDPKKNVDVTNASSVYQYLYNQIADGFTQGHNNDFLLEEFDFFKDTNWQLNWTFNLSVELDYIKNNQPDTTKSVMCTVSDQIIDYTACNHPHWMKIKKHVETYYYHDGGVFIPPGTSLKWTTVQQLFTSGFISTYSSENKTDKFLESYLETLFGKDSACSSATFDDAVCYRTRNGSNMESINVINPWLHGMYNPYSHCDISFSGVTPDASEFINTFIDPSINGKPYPENMPWGEKCYNSKNQRTIKPGPSRFSLDPAYPSDDSPYNLCQHSISDSLDCVHDQGLLGNDDGLPVGTPDPEFNMFYNSKYVDEYNQYSVGKDMYTKSKWKIPDDFQSGLFGGTNTLWTGESGYMGFLKVPDHEIGIHIIEMSISQPNITAGDIYSSMLVTKIPLNADGTTSKPVLEWVPWLLSNISFDAGVNENGDYGEGSVKYTSFAADCPLKRFAFYGRNSTQFRAVSPSPARSKFMFARINNNQKAHPTMTQVTDGRYFGMYKSVNGFCFCPFINDVAQRQCQVPIGVTSACSLDDTVNTLKALDGVWRNSVVMIGKDQLGNSKQCNMQLDWPFINNELRDGSKETQYDESWSDATDKNNKKCHILDRFMPFQYRYKNTRTIKKTSKNTVTDGVCKTGRVSSNGFTVASGVRCVKSNIFAANTEHRCDGSSNTQSLPRRQVKNEFYMFNKYQTEKRTKCNKCSKPPGFTNSMKQPIKPESSFGIPYKLSATKVLSNDLRNVFKSANIEHVINEDYWTSSMFLKTYLKTPHLLLNSVQPTVDNTTTEDWRKDDSYRWRRPWVYCPNAAAFKNNTCLGVIERKDWIAKKTHMCPLTIKTLMQASKFDPMSRTSFANIDKHTNKVALAIQAARDIVLQANCIASGVTSCLPKPFTYHPASYETTNRAWVHDTVLDYYKSKNSTICKSNTRGDLYVSYMAKQQIKCPANSLYLFEGFANILRVFIGTVAIILSSVMSLLFKLLVAFVESNVVSSLNGEWMFLVGKFKGMFVLMSNMAVHMLANSGGIGQALIVFVDTICGAINTVVTMYVTIWCEYVSKYLITFFTIFRKFTGFIQGGFLAISEFVEFVLRYYLPAAMLKKYASSAVQSYMVDKYSEPSEKSERNQKSQLKIVASKPVSKIAYAKNTLAQSSKFATGFLSSGGGKMLAAGMVLATADYIQEMIDEEAREGLIAKVWTPINAFFDFKFMNDASDNMVFFFVDEPTCPKYTFWKEHANGTSYYKCPDFSLIMKTDPNVLKSIAPTLCWATANPSLGESSMYSCTGSSTCCPSTGCSSDKTKNLVCRDCPDPYAAGVSKFACDNMMCKCSVPVQATSMCSSNAMCDSAYCDLISMISSVSFGSLKCSDCPGKTICIASGTTGRCGCIMDKTVNMATCKGSVGVLVYPNPTDLCGYLPRLSASSSQSTFQYADLMGVLCSRSLKTICGTVLLDNGYSVNMPVSLSIRHSQTSRRRHVLSSENDDDLMIPSVYTYENEYDNLDSGTIHDLLHLPNWNLSSAPCSLLAYAYQRKKTLGILEEHELHKCAFWRHVGRTIINDYNLTSLVNLETFLMSMDDLSAAITHKNVLWELTSNPHAILKIMLMHPYLKPLRALIIVSANLFESIFHDQISMHSDDQIINFLFHLNNPNISTTSEPQTTFNKRNTSVISEALRQYIHKDKKPKRKLLVASLSEFDAVQQYSKDIINGIANPPLALVATQSWLRGPNSWPPRYDYSINIDTCPILIISKNAIMEIFSVVVLYFKHFNDPKKHIDRSLKNNLPDFFFRVSNGTIVFGTSKSYASWFFYSVLALFNIQASDLESFFVGHEKWSLLWILQTSIMCDFGSAMSCSRHNKDLFMSIVVFILFYFIINFIGNALALNYISTLYILSFPFFILWYTYGFSPSCLPMLPTCLLDDIIHLIEDLLPLHINFPPKLFCNGRVTNVTLDTPMCLRSCSELGFTSWFDPLTYMVCSYDGPLCLTLVKKTNISMLVPISDSLYKWYQNNDPDYVSSYNFCTFVEWIQVVPFLLLLLVVVIFVSTVFYFLLSLIPAFVVLVGQIISFNHTK